MGKFDDPPDYDPGNSREIRTLDEAIKLLDEWSAAYKELREDYVKLHAEMIRWKFLAETNQTLADNFEVLYKIAIEG